jgi:hypothetical protein
VHGSVYCVCVGMYEYVMYYTSEFMSSCFCGLMSMSTCILNTQTVAWKGAICTGVLRVSIYVLCNQI